MTRKEFENWKDENYGDYRALKTLASKYELDDVVADLIDEDELNLRLENELRNSGWKRCLHFLEGIEDKGAEWFKIDGYSNAVNLEKDDWDCYAKELEDSMKFEKSKGKDR